MLVDETRSIFDLLNTKESIWVINNTRNPACLVALDFGPGIKYPPIPPGPDPICVTEAIPHRALENSYDFRRALETGLLRLLTAASARNYYEINKGRKQALKEKLDSLMMPPKDGVVPEMSEGAVTSRAVDARDLLTAKVLTVCTAFRERNIDEKALLEELISIQEDLNDNDLEYIRSTNSMGAKRFAQEISDKRLRAAVSKKDVIKKEETTHKGHVVRKEEPSRDSDDFPIE